jgi:hypothetical protein
MRDVGDTLLGAQNNGEMDDMAWAPTDAPLVGLGRVTRVTRGGAAVQSEGAIGGMINGGETVARVEIGWQNRAIGRRDVNR